MTEQVSSRARWLLLTGRPGAGKTTAIREAVKGLNIRIGGFYTEEIRSGASRTGFRIRTFDGRAAVLAHADFPGSPRVGRYGVRLDALKEIAVPSLCNAIESADLIVVDEIGKMELLCREFVDALGLASQSAKPVLGTILSAHHPVADGLKASPFVRIRVVGPETRHVVLSELREWLSRNLQCD
jgi:nucleoside-triphosphatase